MKADTNKSAKLQTFKILNKKLKQEKVQQNTTGNKTRNYKCKKLKNNY